MSFGRVGVYLVSSNPVRRRSVMGKRIRAMSVRILVTAIVIRFALPLRQLAEGRSAEHSKSRDTSRHTSSGIAVPSSIS